VKAAVCDASIAFKLIVAEPDSDQALDFVRSVRVIVPEFMFLEIGNVLWSRIRRRDLNVHEAKRLVDCLRGLGFETLQIGPFLDRALQIASSIDHPVYDCLYIAIVEHFSVPLITADKRLISAVRRAGLRNVDVRQLDEFL